LNSIIRRRRLSSQNTNPKLPRFCLEFPLVSVSGASALGYSARRSGRITALAEFVEMLFPDATERETWFWKTL
jgi:hypothetical protein